MLDSFIPSWCPISAKDILLSTNLNLSLYHLNKHIQFTLFWYHLPFGGQIFTKLRAGKNSADHTVTWDSALTEL
jgi:hypothetical protein